jgi:hypothetical protein
MLATEELKIQSDEILKIAGANAVRIKAPGTLPTIENSQLIWDIVSRTQFLFYVHCGGCFER